MQPASVRGEGRKCFREILSSRLGFLRVHLASGEVLRLTGSGENGAPPAARRIEAFDASGEQFNGNMNEALMQKTDDDSRFSSHGGMDGVAGEEIAEDRVFAVRRSA